MKWRPIFNAVIAVWLLAAAACSSGCKASPRAEPEMETTAVLDETSAYPRGENGTGGDTQTAAPPRIDEFVVYVPEAALRLEPKADAPVVARVKEGTRLNYLFPEITVTEGGGVYRIGHEGDPNLPTLPIVQPTVMDPGDSIWRKVEAGGHVGWLEDKYVLRADIYDAFARAHELGRPGDARGMVTAIRAGYKKAPNIVDYDDEYVTVSPDGKKAAAFVPVAEDQEYFYSGFNDVAHCYRPVLFFVVGRGLVEYIWTEKRVYSSDYPGRNAGIWSPDSRYFALPMDCGEMYWHEPLDLLDVERWERLTVGFLSGIEFDRGGGPEYEFAGGYLIWTTDEKILENRPAHLEENSYKPLVMAYEMAGGRRFRVLEADLATAAEELAWLPGAWNIKCYEVKMAPAPGCPDGVKESRLYQKYAHGSATVEDLTHFCE